MRILASCYNCCAHSRRLTNALVLVHNIMELILKAITVDLWDIPVLQTEMSMQSQLQSVA